MEESLLISICIPAYQRTEHLKRLLDSIEIQTFRRFEVVITDDSPGGEVQELVKIHPLKPMVRYFKNPGKLGTPENWNESMRKAKSEWIKIMHDDDWFSGPESLRFFADTIEKGKGRFIFSAFSNVFPNGHFEYVQLKKYRLNRLKRLPEMLISANRIGPPSVVLFKNDAAVVFDNRMQWLVDIDFYIRYLKKYPGAGYISKNLVQIGISESQVTQKSFGNPGIEIPERFLLGEKLNRSAVLNIFIFDSWWRFLRNLSIRNVVQIEKAGYTGVIPDFISAMVKFQNKIPAVLLKRGFPSKFFMLMHYLKRRKTIKAQSLKPNA